MLNNDSRFSLPHRIDLYQTIGVFSDEEKSSESSIGMDVFNESETDSTHSMETSPDNSQDKNTKKLVTDNKTNSQSNRILRERTNVTPKSDKPVKYSRQYFDANEAACITQDEEYKIQGGCDEDSIKHHAFMRIQSFALMVVGHYGIAKRSGGKEDREIKMAVKSSALQVGKASNCGIHKFHGAHSHAFSGFDIGDFRETLIKELVDDLKTWLNDGDKEKTIFEISPTKKRIFTSKKINEEQLKNIVNIIVSGITANHDEQTILDSIRVEFDTVWPVYKNKPNSMLTGTATDVTINATTEVPIQVNLGVDKLVERLRDEIKEILLQKVVHKEITEEEACKQYSALIIDLFTKLEPKMENLIVLLTGFETGLLKLEAYKSMPDVKINASKDKIYALLLDLNIKAKIISPPQKKKVKVVDKENVMLDKENVIVDKENVMLDKENVITKKEVVPKERKPTNPITKNMHFLKQSIDSIEKLDSLDTFKNWMTRKWDLLKKEITGQHKSLSTYLKYCRWEKAGTELPDFKALFGEFNPVTGERELNEKTLSNVQEMIWRPNSPTPTAKTKRVRPEPVIIEKLPESQAKKVRRTSIS